MLAEQAARYVGAMSRVLQRSASASLKRWVRT
jgi:hypothetical protein